MGGLFCSKEKQENFSMAKGNVQLEHECFPKHFRMGRTTMKRENNNNIIILLGSFTPKFGLL